MPTVLYMIFIESVKVLLEMQDNSPTLCKTRHFKKRSSIILEQNLLLCLSYPRKSLKRQNSIRDPATTPCFQGPPVPSMAWIREV